MPHILQESPTTVSDGGQAHGAQIHAQQFVEYLETTLIPDLFLEGEAAIAKHFETTIDFINGDASRYGWDQMGFIEFLRDKLIPHLRVLDDSRAEDFEVGITHIESTPYTHGSCDQMPMGLDGPLDTGNFDIVETALREVIRRQFHMLRW